MRKNFLLLAAIGFGIAGMAHADVLAVPEASAETVKTPQRGMTQTAVIRDFGAPVKRYPPVGGGTPKHPPITRWDYAGYSVFFERNLVIDVVIKDAPVPIRHKDELQAGP